MSFPCGQKIPANISKGLTSECKYTMDSTCDIVPKTTIHTYYTLSGSLIKGGRFVHLYYKECLCCHQISPVNGLEIQKYEQDMDILNKELNS